MDFSSQFKPKRNFLEFIPGTVFLFRNKAKGLRPSRARGRRRVDINPSTRGWTSCVTAVMTSDQMQMVLFVFFFNFKLLTDHFGFFV